MPSLTKVFIAVDWAECNEEEALAFVIAEL